MSIAASVETFLKGRGVPYSTFEHRLAYTAREEAAVTHVPERNWAKTVVCIADGQPIQVVLPADMTVDLARLRQQVGAGTVRLANEKELVGFYPDCEVGAMPPLGPIYGQRVYVDRSLVDDPEVVFNAGTHVDAVRMRYADFAALTQPVIGDYCRPAH